MKKFTPITLLLMLSIIVSACAASTESGGFSQPFESVSPSPATPEPLSQSHSNDFLEPQASRVMPDPFEHVGGGGDHEFFFPFILKLDEMGVFVPIISDYLGLTEEEYFQDVRERLEIGFMEGQDDCLRFANIFTIIIEFDIPNEVVAEYFRQHNEMQQSFNELFGDGAFDDRKFTDAQIEAILSRDATRVLAQFATEHAIVIGDRAFSPAWLYFNNPEDYHRVGITSEILRERLELGLLDAFPFTDIASVAFEEKLSEFMGESVTIAN